MKIRGRVVSSTEGDHGRDRAAEPGGYEPPTFVRLGTLAELTLGDAGGSDDGMGGQQPGDVGSL